MSVQSCTIESLKSALSSIDQPTQGNRNTLGNHLIRWMELASTENLLKLQKSHEKVFQHLIPRATRELRADQLIAGMRVHGDMGIDIIDHVGNKPEDPGTEYLYAGEGPVFVTYHLSHARLRYYYHDLLDIGIKWILDHHRKPRRLPQKTT